MQSLTCCRERMLFAGWDDDDTCIRTAAPVGTSPPRTSRRTAGPSGMCCETSWWSNEPAVDPSPDTDPDGPETPARSRPTSGSGKSRRSTCGLRTREDRVRTSLPFKIIKRISPVLDSDWLSRVRSWKVTHTFVYICVARQPLWCVAATTVSEELHCLAEEYYHYIYLLCFILWTVL